MSVQKSGGFTVITFGVLSAGLYTLLYFYSDVFLDLAQQVRNGDRALFLVPIAVAFIFSFVHGAFTGHFWDWLGLKPANNKK